MYNVVVANIILICINKMIDTNWEIKEKLLGKQKLEVKIVNNFIVDEIWAWLYI